MKKLNASVPEEEMRARMIKVVGASIAKRGLTTLEKAVAAVLQEKGVVFETNKSIGRYFADFFIADMNLVLECDGEYWHSVDWRIEHDARREQWLLTNGYRVAHLTGPEIRADCRGAVERVLAQWGER